MLVDQLLQLLDLGSGSLELGRRDRVAWHRDRELNAGCFLRITFANVSPEQDDQCKRRGSRRLRGIERGRQRTYDTGIDPLQRPRSCFCFRFPTLQGIDELEQWLAHGIRERDSGRINESDLTNSPRLSFIRVASLQLVSAYSSRRSTSEERNVFTMRVRET